MNLATSRYQAADLILRSGRVPVGITYGNPRWPLPYKLAGNFRQLAPSKDMFGMEDRCMFEEAYRDKLDRLGVAGVTKLLQKVVDATGNDRLCLLCFEDLTKPGLWCHRRLFANWWLEKTGEDVPELEPAVRQERLFQ